MVKPNIRETQVVVTIPALEKREIEDLKDILFALGFDYGTVALIWNKSDAQTKEAFSSSGISGADLVLLCSTIGFRPGIVQRRLNFDKSESRVKTRKTGFSGSMSFSKWTGPPELCVTGNASDGRAFREVYQATGVSGRIPTRNQLDRKELQQIANGNRPVHFGQLVDLMKAVVSGGLNHPKLKRLQKVVDTFPKEVKTAEEVFAPTSETEEAGIRTTSGNSDEGNKMTNEFTKRFVGSGLGRVVVKVVEDNGIEAWMDSQLSMDDEALSDLADGELGMDEVSFGIFVAHCRNMGISACELDELSAFSEEAGNEKPVEIQSPTTTITIPESENQIVNQGNLDRVIWSGNGGSVMIGGIVIDLTSSGDASKLIYTFMQKFAANKKKTFEALADDILMAVHKQVGLKKGSLRISKPEAERWAQELGITIPTLFGFGSVAAPLQTESTHQSEQATSKLASAEISSGGGTKKVDGRKAKTEPYRAEYKGQKKEFDLTNKGTRIRFVKRLGVIRKGRDITWSKISSYTGASSAFFSTMKASGSGRLTAHILEHASEFVGVDPALLLFDGVSNEELIVVSVDSAPLRAIDDGLSSEVSLKDVPTKGSDVGAGKREKIVPVIQKAPSREMPNIPLGRDTRSVFEMLLTTDSVPKDVLTVIAIAALRREEVDYGRLVAESFGSTLMDIVPLVQELLTSVEGKALAELTLSQIASMDSSLSSE